MKGGVTAPPMFNCSPTILKGEEPSVQMTLILPFWICGQTETLLRVWLVASSVDQAASHTPALHLQYWMALPAALAMQNIQTDVPSEIMATPAWDLKVSVGIVLPLPQLVPLKRRCVNVLVLLW